MLKVIIFTDIFFDLIFLMKKYFSISNFIALVNNILHFFVVHTTI